MQAKVQGWQAAAGLSLWVIKRSARAVARQAAQAKLLRSQKQRFGSRMLQTAQLDAAQGARGQASEGCRGLMLLLTGGCSSVSAMFGEPHSRKLPLLRKSPSRKTVALCAMPHLGVSSDDDCLLLSHPHSCSSIEQQNRATGAPT
eukprot:4246-Heterococcus_DN1.PRE.2